MADTKLRFEGDGLTVAIRGPSTDGMGLDLLTAAVTTLIESADTHHAEKRGNGDAAAEFYAAVLAAVARHYAVDASELEAVDEDRDSVGALLEQLLGELRQGGRL